MDDPWRFGLLGDFTALSPTGTEVRFPGRKHQALLAILLMSPGRVVARERIIGLLWGSRSEDQARASLRGVLSEIRRACRPLGEELIETDRTQVKFSGNSVEIDVDQVFTAAKHRSIDHFSSVASLYSGDFLQSLNLNEKLFEEWKILEQENIRMTYRRVMLDYLLHLEQTENLSKLQSVANTLLKMDEADEEAHRFLIKMHKIQGSNSLAHQQYQQCADRLMAKYGISPSAGTSELLQGVHSSTNTVPTVEQDVTGSALSSGQNLEFALVILPFEVTKSPTIDSEFGLLLSTEVVGVAAKFKWYRVISSRVLSGLNANGLSPTEIGEKTGAKYSLHGVIREFGQQHRLIVELVDCTSSNTVWSERFDLDEDNIAYPDDIVSVLVSRLDVKLRANEIRLVHLIEESDRNAYHYTLLAMANMYDLSEAAYLETEEMFDTAVRLSPNTSWFYSSWALWKMFCLGQMWASDREQETRHAADLARRAIKINPEDALALVIAGHFESFWAHNLEQGKALVDNSLELNPYSSFAWMLSSATYSYLGESNEALRRLEKSKALCPVEPHFEFFFDNASCLAYLVQFDAENAARWGLKTVSENPRFTNGYKHLLVALGHIGAKKDCQIYWSKLKLLEPDFSITPFVNSMPFTDMSIKNYYREGLLKAGLPNDNGNSCFKIVD